MPKLIKFYVYVFIIDWVSACIVDCFVAALLARHFRAFQGGTAVPP